jgi:hypothetical protein
MQLTYAACERGFLDARALETCDVLLDWPILIKIEQGLVMQSWLAGDELQPTQRISRRGRARERPKAASAQHKSARRAISCDLL